MGAYLGAQAFFNIPIVEVAKKYSYAKDNLLILEGNESALKVEYPETYSNIISCKHHADKRTPLEYAQDIVASWLVEDSFFHMLNSQGLSAQFHGVDRNRKILSNVKTSTASDFLVSFNGNKRNLELMNDYTGFWQKHHILHLRDNKFLKMRKERSLFLAVSMTDKTYALFDFREDLNYEYINSHFPYGGKPAYAIHFADECLKDATSQNIINEIIIHM